MVECPKCSREHSSVILEQIDNYGWALNFEKARKDKGLEVLREDVERVIMLKEDNSDKYSIYAEGLFLLKDGRTCRLVIQWTIPVYANDEEGSVQSDGWIEILPAEA